MRRASGSFASERTYFGLGLASRGDAPLSPARRRSAKANELAARRGDCYPAAVKVMAATSILRQTAKSVRRFGARRDRLRRRPAIDSAACACLDKAVQPMKPYSLHGMPNGRRQRLRDVHCAASVVSASPRSFARRDGRVSAEVRFRSSDAHHWWGGQRWYEPGP